MIRFFDFFSILWQITALATRMLWFRATGKKVIFLDYFSPQFEAFYAPIVDELKKLEDFRIVLIAQFSAGRLLHDKSDLKVAGCDPDFIIDWRALPIVFQSGVYVSAKLESNLSRGIRVYISHNMPVKYLRPSRDQLKRHNVIFLTCPAHEQQIREALEFYSIPEGDVSLLRIGIPKIDALAKPPTLSPHRPENTKIVVLFAPTWDPGLILTDFGAEIIERLASILSIRLIVQLHPASHLTSEKEEGYELLTSGRNWRKIVEDISLRFDFEVQNSTNSTNLIAYADVLISDVSSIIHEFALTGKPVIAYQPISYFEVVSREIYRGFHNHTRTAQELYDDPLIRPRVDYTFSSASELVEKIERIRDFGFSRTRPLDTNFVPFNFGSATAKAAEAIAALYPPNRQRF